MGGPSLYNDQGVKHVKAREGVSHTWKGTEPWRPSGAPFARDSDWDEKGAPDAKANEVTNQPEMLRQNRPINDGSLQNESCRVGFFRSNLATGLNCAPFHRPETFLVKVEPAQNVGIGDVKMNAKAWITYYSKWEFVKSKTRFLQMDISNYKTQNTPANLGAQWWLQATYPRATFVDRSTIYLDTMQRYQRRGAASNPCIVYGNAGQTGSTSALQG